MRKTVSAALMCLLLCACSPVPASQPQKAVFFAMDTVMDCTIYGEQELLNDVQSMVTALEAVVSVTDEVSAVSIINRTGQGTLSGSAQILMDEALTLCQRTEGALDISIYPVVRSWGFTTGEYHVPTDSELQALLPNVDYTKIQYDVHSGAVAIPTDMQIDLGSVAKGFIGREAAAYLRKHGVSSALLNLGGNVQTVGSKPDGSPWKIAVKNPNSSEPMMVLSVRNQAVVTSGGYERYFEENRHTYWHIMNPKTGSPAESGLLSVTVVGEDGLVCDGLSTALFVMGLEKAAALWRASEDFEAIFVTDTGEVYLTEGLKEQFALTEDYRDTSVSVIQR